MIKIETSSNTETEHNCLYTFLFFFIFIKEASEEFEDTKGVIRIRKSKMDRQHNGKKYKRATQTLLKIGGELRCSWNGKQFLIDMWHSS